jgi:hypothetical protein
MESEKPQELPSLSWRCTIADGATPVHAWRLRTRCNKFKSESKGQRSRNSDVWGKDVGEDGFPGSNRKQISLSPSFCSPKALDRLDDAYPLCRRWIFLSLRTHMLTLSGTLSQTHLETMFHQLSGNPLAHSSWHINSPPPQQTRVWTLALHVHLRNK